MFDVSFEGAVGFFHFRVFERRLEMKQDLENV